MNESVDIAWLLTSLVGYEKRGKHIFSENSAQMKDAEEFTVFEIRTCSICFELMSTLRLMAC